jgi:hypothetical protein
MSCVVIPRKIIELVQFSVENFQSGGFFIMLPSQIFRFEQQVRYQY